MPQSDRKFMIEPPVYGIVETQRLKSHDLVGALVPCPVEGKYGRTLMIFTTREKALDTIQAMKLPAVFQLETIPDATSLDHVLRGVQREGDTHVGIDTVIKPGPIAEGKFFSIADMLSACAFWIALDES
jgi:hypothetical protein